MVWMRSRWQCLAENQLRPPPSRRFPHNEGGSIDGIVAKLKHLAYGEGWFKTRNPQYSQYEGRRERRNEPWARGRLVLIRWTCTQH